MIDREMIATWLEVACLAPSPHNNQPWVARAAPDGVILRLDHQLLPLLGPDRVQFIALGAFIENMSFAAAVDGYRLAVDELPTVPRRTSEITVRFRDGAEAWRECRNYAGGGQTASDEPWPIRVHPSVRSH
jgi:hypothetical protein